MRQYNQQHTDEKFVHLRQEPTQSREYQVHVPIAVSICREFTCQPGKQRAQDAKSY